MKNAVHRDQNEDNFDECCSSEDTSSVSMPQINGIQDARNQMECSEKSNNSKLDKTVKIQNVVTAPSTMEDALKMLENHRSNIANTSNISNTNKSMESPLESPPETEYLRSIQPMDRIRVQVSDSKEWQRGTVISVENDNEITVQMDGGRGFDRSAQKQQILLNAVIWDFEPENFAPPRYLKKVNGAERESNDDVHFGHDVVVNNDEYGVVDVDTKMKETQNRKIDSTELRCGQLIAFKTLELVNWEPVCSQMKIGKIVKMNEGTVSVKIGNDEQCIDLSSFSEIYEIEGGDATNRECEEQLIVQEPKCEGAVKEQTGNVKASIDRNDLIKEKRRKRRQRQRERKRKRKQNTSTNDFI